MSFSASNDQSILSATPRWAVRIFAWIGFAICAYLAWKAVAGNGPSSACIGGSADCDAVQSSHWSVWLGLPVAIAGLACYATLAGLSVLAGLSGARAMRWIGTPLVLLSFTAALCGVWFTGIQFFVLGKFCMECIALHVCGITIAGLVIWGFFTRARPTATRPAAAARAAVPGMAAIRATAPVAPGLVVPRAAPRMALAPAGPSWAIAVGGALGLLVALAGGQVLFPADTSYQSQVALNETVELTSANVDVADNAASEPGTPSADAVSYQANRIPTDIRADDVGVVPAAGESAFDAADGGIAPSENGLDDVAQDTEISSESPTATAPAATAPRGERLVKILGGKVTLDVYQHPVLGNPEAPHVVVEFVSYDCSHCHLMHRMVQKALSRYGSQVAVVILPYPQEIECNKEITNAAASITGACATARMALGVAALDPAKFAKFHDWLMAGKDKPPTPSQAVQRAYTTVGRDRMRQLSRDKLHTQLAQYVDLYLKVKATMPDPAKVGLPLMVIGDKAVSGSHGSDEDLFRLWEDNLGVKPVRGATLPELSSEFSAGSGL